MIITKQQKNNQEINFRPKIIDCAKIISVYKLANDFDNDHKKGELFESMVNFEIKSNFTFLYFEDVKAARQFFEEVLHLPLVKDFGWAVIYGLGDKSFLGVVNEKDSSIKIESHNGVLVSFTVNDVENIFNEMKRKKVSGLSALKQVKGVDLISFFIEGPEGYKFEIQQFTSDELTKLF